MMTAASNAVKTSSYKNYCGFCFSPFLEQFLSSNYSVIIRNFAGKPEGLSIEQFRSAMKKTIAYDIADDELEKMFMKVGQN